MRGSGAFFFALFSIALCTQLAAAPAIKNPAEENLAANESAESESTSTGDESLDDLLDMDLDQLSQTQVHVTEAFDEVVTSVSRQESTVGRSPAAVFVITQEMIRRSGANNIPDVLRMAPGIEVARVTANKWAISSRGFNNAFANKLLVQIDGRVVYNQTYNGVYWDVQDVVLQDVERIEVIRGPGATVWGANAVNGIINIITKRASDTQGLMVLGGTGTEERGFATLRYGGQVTEDWHWRVYGKQFERDSGYFLGDDFDDWRQVRGGFRSDWTPNHADHITIQGDYYEGDSGSADVLAIPPAISQLAHSSDVSGMNLLARWSRSLGDDSGWSLQAYYDDAQRDDSALLLQNQQTVDVDFQHNFAWGDRHNFIWGCGYRYVIDEAIGMFPASYDPAKRKTNLYSTFIQDEMKLVEDRWYFTMGSKFEHNAYSGFEAQPSVRLLYLPSAQQSAWAAVSRAVRTPGRTDQDVLYYTPISTVGPTFGELRGDPGTDAEDVLAFECGYREQTTDWFSWDLALFYNEYRYLIEVLPAGGPAFDPGLGAVTVPLLLTNSGTAESGGAELGTNLQLTEDWELTGAYTLQYLDYHGTPTNVTEGSSPHNRLYLRSSWTSPGGIEVDLIARYVDRLRDLDIPSYFVADARVGWSPRPGCDVSLVARNLLDGTHPEFSDTLAGTVGTEVQPEFFCVFTLRR